MILVEAKPAGEKKLVERHQPQLASYFDKTKRAKIGILTSGVEWRFFTDRDTPNRMDAEPFETWNVLHDKQPPTELLGILEKGWLYHPSDSGIHRWATLIVRR